MFRAFDPGDLAGGQFQYLVHVFEHMGRRFLRPRPSRLGPRVPRAGPTGPAVPRGPRRLAQLVQGAVDPLAHQYQGGGDFLGEGPGQGLVPVGAQSAPQDHRGVLERGHGRGVHHQRAGQAGQGYQAGLVEVEAEGGRGNVFQLVRLVKDH